MTYKQPKQDEEFYEDLLGRGAGDPDVSGYPGEPIDTTPPHNETDPQPF